MFPEGYAAWSPVRWIGLALAAFLAFLMAVGVLIAAFGAVLGTTMSAPGSYGPSTVAIADIPALYLRLYQAAGERYGLDWAILAGIGSIETDHGRSAAAGVRSGVNGYGCCAGPMQFNIRNGPPSTWDTYGHGGDVYDPRDAIPAAARMLRANGAPNDYRRAILAYNHDSWYLHQVLAKAGRYRGAMDRWNVGSFPVDADVTQVLRNPNIHLTGPQRADLRSGTIDPRLVATMQWIATSHSFMVTALRSDHSPNTVEGNRSNHADGRAMDIGMVDNHVCVNATPRDPCGQLLLELAAVHGPMRSTELIGCFDPDGPDDPRGFARADHCDHDHVGWDAD